MTPPLPKPEFVFTDTTALYSKTSGYVTLFSSGIRLPGSMSYAHGESGAALKWLPAGISDQVKLVFVTTDRARDTPAVLRTWFDDFDRGLIGLAGTEAAIEQVARAARFLSLGARSAAFC